MAENTSVPRWDDITKSDLFTSLPSSGREQIRLDYFNDFVAPHVPENEIADYRASFDNDTAPSVLGLTSLADFKRANPHFAQVPDKSLFEYVHQKYYPNSSKDDLARVLDYGDFNDPGYAGELVSGVKHGAMVGTPGLIGKALKFAGADETGDNLIEFAEGNEKKYRESVAGEKAGIGVRGSLHEGGSALVSSQAVPLTMAAAGAATGLIVPVVGPFIGALVGFGVGSLAQLPIFYGAAAQESYEAVKKNLTAQGRDPAEVETIARKTAHTEGAIEAGSELAGDVISLFVGSKLFPTGQAAGAIVKGLVKPTLRRAVGVGTGIVATEVGEEVIAGVGEPLARQHIGETGEGPNFQDVASVILPTAIATLPLGIGAGVNVHVRKQQITLALENENTPPENRAKAALATASAIERVNKDVAKGFSLYAADAIQEGRPIEIQDDQFYLGYQQQKLAKRTDEQVASDIISAPTVDAAIEAAKTAVTVPIITMPRPEQPGIAATKPAPTATPVSPEMGITPSAPPFIAPETRPVEQKEPIGVAPAVAPAPATPIGSGIGQGLQPATEPKTPMQFAFEKARQRRTEQARTKEPPKPAIAAPAQPPIIVPEAAPAVPPVLPEQSIRQNRDRDRIAVVQKAQVAQPLVSALATAQAETAVGQIAATAAKPQPERPMQIAGESWWNGLTEQQRLDAAIKAGWYTAKGTPSFTAKRFAKRSWTEITEGSRNTLLRKNEVKQAAITVTEAATKIVPAKSERQQKINEELETAKFTTAEIPLKDINGNVFASAKGSSIGGLMVHKEHGKNTYNVTHMASGGKVLGGIITQRGAKIAAMRISKLTDFTQSRDVLNKVILNDRSLTDKVRAIRQDVYADFGEEKVTPSRAETVTEPAKETATAKPQIQEAAQPKTVRPEIKPQETTPKAATEAVQTTVAKATTEAVKELVGAIKDLKAEVAELRKEPAEQKKPEKPAAAPVTETDALLADPRLSGITVRVKAIEAETGRQISYDEKADVALRDVNERIDMAKRLLECLAS